MIKKIPGTVVDFSIEYKERAFSVIEPVFAVTDGLTLAQVREITGLETSTIQNWVRRGWVARPQNKRYGKLSLLRIILINSIRGILQIEKIAELMIYINGDVEDTEDDIISDEELFNCFCKIIADLVDLQSFDINMVSYHVEENIKVYENMEKNAFERLKKALYVMIIAYLAAQFKDLANAEFEKNIII